MDPQRAPRSPEGLKTAPGAAKKAPRKFPDPKTMEDPWFLPCFVKVAHFRTRTETIDNLLWNAKKQPLKIDRKSIKN